jgi:hypothetical protein
MTTMRSLLPAPILPTLTLAVCLYTLSHAADPTATSLFNGQSLDGWEVRPASLAEKCWKVQDNTIVIENDGGPGSDLWTTSSYKDYELELEFKTLTEDYDTGVFLHGNGHQVQIGISGSLKVDMTACIYAPEDKKGSYPGKTDKVQEVNQAGKWNHLRIVLTGQRIQTFLNQQPMVDYTSIALRDEGPIGLQLHGNRTMKVLFRNIRVKKL